MITIFWTINSILLILTILIHNPKAQNVSGQNQLFVSTRSSEAKLNKFTWILIALFFTLSLYLALLK